MSRAVRIAIAKPNEKQKAFFLARSKHVGYGGARGGGKSWAVRQKAVMMGAMYPGIKMLIVRRTYPELIQNHVNFLVPQMHGLARYNKSEKEFVYINGSRLKMGYCDSEKDLLQYQGAEYDVIFFDEATQLQEDWLKKIAVSCRGVNGFPKRIYYTCNPGGVGHGYIKRLFIDRRFEAGEDAEEYEFIQALVTDNTALMEAQPEYKRALDALPPKLRKAWRDGSWDVYEGQFFEDFVDRPEGYDTRQYTHVIPAMKRIPPEWTIYRSFDWGYAKPFSCGWWGVDYDGVVYRILEFYGCTQEPNTGIKWPPDQVFQKIAEIEREHPYLAGKRIMGVADPAIWNAEHGESIAETAAKYGVYFEKGDHARIAGWMQMHYRLQFDEEGYARMYVFDNCKAFIRTIPLLQYSRTQVEDIDTDMEDHAADEARYFLMMRPVEPMRAPEEKEYKPFIDPLDQLKGQGRKNK